MCPTKEYLVYIVTGHKILCFDLRRPEIILKETCALFDYNEEEVNQIAISNDGKFLAACDDTGETKVIDIENSVLFKTLRKRHKNVCSSVLFRPNNMMEVITGSLDCTIVHWNLSRGRPLYQEDLGSEPTTAQTLNPPMVYSLSITPDGKTLAAGLGDGSVAVFPVGTWKRSHNLLGHETSVSLVEFAGFSPHHLFSGSNDSTILLWDLRKKRKYSMYEPQGDLPIVLKITHSSKPNWLVSSKDNKLFVADQSNSIAVFSVRG